VPEVDEPLLRRIRTEIVERALAGMEQEGRPYHGVLYAGLMLTPQGPKVLEFNCRFGDPETQVLLPLLESELLDLLLAVPEGRIGDIRPVWGPGSSCGVVLASEGYPGSIRTGVPIDGLDDLEPGVLVFHAGTARRADLRPSGTWDSLRQGLGLAPSDADLVTAGGRVLTVVAAGPTLAEARERVYAAVTVVRIPGMQYRRDIGLERNAVLGTGGQRPGDRGEVSHGALAQEAGAKAQPVETGALQVRPDGAGSAPSGPSNSGVAGQAATGSPSSPAAPAPGPRPLASDPDPGGIAALVAIIMGSESDREVMQQAAAALDSLGIANEMHVMSAHRTPQKVQAFAQEAEARGLRAIIAGAGMAAHLPGVIASWTTLPVIGVPLAAGELRGLDSLYAIVQMPPGVPVATVGIGAAGARNAAYLAASVLALSDEGIRQRYQEFRRKQSGG
jgi:phosphoribosylaminoimidazole carboxylase PurE protein